MKKLQDKVAIITGAGGGIGAAIARLFASEGARLVLTDINENAVKKTTDAIATDALAIEHDVTSESSWQNVMDKTLEKFGRLDVLVNNAGILHVGDVAHTSLEDWKRVQAVNSDGVFLGCKLAVPRMEKSGGGSIINISSNSANMAISTFCAYSASKGAVRSLTKSVAAYCRERNRGVRCNSVHPKGVATRMITSMFDGITDEAVRGNLMGKLSSPDDIAPMILFLACDDGKLANGAEFTIDEAEGIHFKP
ncbi:MAG TPA: SDR family oxidoreductase [Pseudomonadales bacterium]|nr:SDR family oxidoreductase [Pseudomonadales bacterium]